MTARAIAEYLEKEWAETKRQCATRIARSIAAAILLAAVALDLALTRLLFGLSPSLHCMRRLLLATPLTLASSAIGSAVGILALAAALLALVVRRRGNRMEAYVALVAGFILALHLHALDDEFFPSRWRPMQHVSQASSDNPAQLPAGIE